MKSKNLLLKNIQIAVQETIPGKIINIWEYDNLFFSSVAEAV